MYPHFNIMLFKFVFVQKAFFALFCLFNDRQYLNCQNFSREKGRLEVAKLLRHFVFALFWNLFFMRKGSQLRIYADLVRFQSRVKGPMHITILMKSIILFFIHSFHVLTLVYEQEKSKNNM